MSKEILEQLHKSATRMEGADPRWLLNNEEPQIDFTEYGAGPVNLVLLHGLFGAMTNWDGAIPFFSQFASTTALHFPILTAHRSEVKVKALACLTEYFLRKRNKHPVVLCGNSLGGHVALRLALSSPELVDALVLTGSSGLYEHTVDTLPIRPGPDFVRSQMQRVFYNDQLITDAAVDEVCTILKNKLSQINLIHSARSAKRDFLLERLKEINIPVLLVWGKDDLVTTMDVAETFNRELPKSKLIVFNKCGHAPMIEYPQKFAQEVQSFLKGLNLI